MYEEEEEEQVTKIVIPKNKILYSDFETFKKDINEANITSERINTNPNNVSDKKDSNKSNYTEKILEYATLSLEGCEFNKDIATKFKKYLDEDPELNLASVSNAEKNIEEFGVWQVVVGRQFIASISFDAKYLLYFFFEELGKYFLVFRS